ncbi:unnamed protein product [Brassicogethes aeneus]|uniref:Uncharacterized protein n=1 Tax=Brassicogethes aeneus TaxID=1431903 RepID=A0A9P0FQ00_BRAAE|nr:unnamed protein product [Brassicogethes aeneus]
MKHIHAMDEKSVENLEEEVPESLKNSFFKSIRNYFREYCVCSSIHGFRYFGEKRTYFERGWWFIVFSITLGICIFFIREVYLKWDRSPVIVSFATTQTPIYQIPFPAVTICPETKLQQNLFNYTEILQKMVKDQNDNITEKEYKLFEYMSMVCNTPDQFGNEEILDKDFFEVLRNVNIVFSDIFIYCEYMGMQYKCKNMFNPIITDEGICYSFNMLDKSEIYNPKVVHHKYLNNVPNKTRSGWSMEDGYADNVGVDTYPKRALLAGTKNSLQVTLISRKTNIDYTCKSSLQGFRVMLHTPTRVPLFSQQYFRVPLNQEVVAAIQPNMITTSDSVKMYNPQRRKCYFPSERKLKFFLKYTSLNCKLECLANYTLNECGCVGFYMPRFNDTLLCGSASRECMRRAERKLQMGTLYNDIIFSKQKNRTRKTKINGYKKLKFCDCMPICTDFTYDVETSQTDWQYIKNLKVLYDEEQLNEDEIHISKLNLFFKSSNFITSVRHELYGPTDFLANFGGLLGLFTGFSILSLMEIFYFLSVRLICNVRLYGYWAGPER